MHRPSGLCSASLGSFPLPGCIPLYDWGEVSQRLAYLSNTTTSCGTFVCLQSYKQGVWDTSAHNLSVTWIWVSEKTSSTQLVNKGDGKTPPLDMRRIRRLASS